MRRANDRAWAVAAILAAATCWGTIGTSYVLILDRIAIDGITVVTIRACAAVAVIWLWATLRDRSALRLPREQLRTFVIFGSLSVTVNYVALIYTFEATSVAVGTMLLFVAPAFVTLGAARFFGERITRQKTVALTLTFGGVALVVRAYDLTHLDLSLAGLGLGLLAAMSYASYSLFAKSLLGQHSPASVVSYNLLIGAIGLIAIKLLLSPTEWPALRDVLLVAGYTGLVTTLIPLTLYTIGLRRLPSSEASILSTFEPVVALVLAATVLGETMAAGQWLGTLCVLAGVTLLSWRWGQPRRWHAASRIAR